MTIAAPAAMAQCVPGLPCVTDKTDNDPTNKNDGPQRLRRTQRR